MAEWRKPNGPTIDYLQEAHFRYEDTQRLNLKGQKETAHANSNLKRPGMSTLMSDKTDFKSGKFTREKDFI